MELILRRISTNPPIAPFQFIFEIVLFLLLMLNASSTIPQLLLRGRPLQHAEAFFAYQQVNIFLIIFIFFFICLWFFKVVSVAACRVNKPLDEKLVKQASEMVSKVFLASVFLFLSAMIFLIFNCVLVDTH